ncbi:hypothetical protein FAES_1869 [Fibrella aestuarina BUZ 2]|uniref:3-keto-disaccharide hydrolase domain-containing protein n=1 Tax=Fibrella aestuarina BUZ 2 TaxID=1166018 RepID=I0K6X5_9BACT|nr:hypothetical protein [Fibrella aestuarina]CCG99878.1 hypothetical protein FAES_1869 [Fibrella aestuarina BUZ 2]
MRTLFSISCFLLTTAVAVGQKAPIVSSASNWAVLVITPADTVAKAGNEAVASGKTKATKATRSKAKATAPSPAPAVTSTSPEPTRVAEAPAPEKAPAERTPDRLPLPKPSTAPKGTSRSFLETFADNHNGWLTGRRNGFELELADDNSYYIRSQRPVDNGQSLARPGRSYIKLPDNLNLNRADTFTVSVEMVMPPGIAPDAGLLIGVKDTSNYCQFRLLDKNKVALYTRVNGTSQAGYMAGKPTLAKVPIDVKRNTLTIRRTGDQLHFYINGREVEDSPHPYRPFKGNGIGFISYANAVKFQYLTVQLGK